MNETPWLFAGEWPDPPQGGQGDGPIPPKATAPLPPLEPTTEELGYPEMIVAGTRAVNLAREAQRWWWGLSHRQRAGYLRRFRDCLLDHLDEVLLTVAAETHKPRLDIAQEVFFCCDVIGYFARQAGRFLKSRRVRPHLLVHKRAEIRLHPLGVIGLITPCNYPLVLNIVPLTQALLAGNAVVLKPSERLPQTTALLETLLAETGLAQPVVQVLRGGPAAAVALVASGVNKVAFTGGARGGHAVAQMAASMNVPLSLELGGNDAFLVAADADLERAAQAAVWGAFLNAGQSCIAVERCFVERKVAACFIERVVALTKTLRLGRFNPADQFPTDDYDVGPLGTLAQRRHVEELLVDACQQGAMLLTGGVPADPAELLFPPTVLSNITPTMRLSREETFGPLLPIAMVETLAEAVPLVNASPLGLSASIWTADRRLAATLIDQLDVGGVTINDCMVDFGIVELPFGGVKGSGVGRTKGREGLLEFCATKTVTHHWLGPRLEFHWFPYGGKYQLITHAARLFFRSGRGRWAGLRGLLQSLFSRRES